MNQVEALEQAILDRAKQLAQEAKVRGENGRNNILRESSDRLQILEEKETLLARSMADRAYRRQVQADELKLHSHMDHLRWNLVQTVIQRLNERIQTFTQDKDKYTELLKGLLKSAAAVIDRDELIIELNASDQQLLKANWDDFVKDAAGDKTITLADKPINTKGGLKVSSMDNRIRIDQTFEGRMERLQRRIHQAIVEQLLPHDGNRT